MSSERDSFAKGIFSTFAKGFLLHKLLLKVNYSPLRVKKSRSHDMGHCHVIGNFTPSDQQNMTFCEGVNDVVMSLSSQFSRPPCAGW
jgi:hypothetical protein